MKVSLSPNSSEIGWTLLVILRCPIFVIRPLSLSPRSLLSPTLLVVSIKREHHHLHCLNLEKSPSSSLYQYLLIWYFVGCLYKGRAPSSYISCISNCAGRLNTEEKTGTSPKQLSSSCPGHFPRYFDISLSCTLYRVVLTGPPYFQFPNSFYSTVLS